MKQEIEAKLEKLKTILKDFTSLSQDEIIYYDGQVDVLEWLLERADECFLNNVAFDQTS